jgi:predicted TPR repeat methyltransferase
VVAEFFSLNEKSQLAKAAELYRGLLAQNPRNAEVLSLLAAIEAQQGDSSAAIAMIDRAIELEPGNASFFASRGNMLQQMNRFEEALASYNHALAMKPDFATVLFSRGNVLYHLKRFEDALASYDRGLAIKPDHAEALHFRGLALRELKRFEEALASIDKALAIKPDFKKAVINREMALLGLGRVTRYPALAAQALFDEIADCYDQIMLDGLAYRAPMHVRNLADRVLAGSARPSRILDLGTGTGLVGEAFRDMAEGGRIDGIDLSPRMIEMARARGVYYDLIHGDIETVLNQPGPSYDLILAADAMVYLGDLALTFSGVAKRLMQDGFYVFTCESKAGEGWEKTPANRFRHSEKYLRDAAAQAGLALASLMECHLRNQAQEPVPGFAVALRKREGFTGTSAPHP